MPRQNPIPYIPKQPQSVYASRKASQAAALLGNVGALVSLGTNLQVQQQQKANVEQEARLKIETLNQQANVEADQARQQEAAREAQRTEQSANFMAQQFARASREIEQTERQGIYGVVNSLSESELRSANARGLGFTTPEAIDLTDRALGERQANLDFPRLLEAITLDESKLPSEHLQRFLQGQNMGSELAQTAYAATLSDRVNVYEKNAVLNRAAKSQKLAEQNAIDGFQFNIVHGFDTLNKDNFQRYFSGLYRGLKASNQAITEQEVKAYAVAALQPLFIGDGARFSAAEGLLKLGALFGSDDESLTDSERLASAKPKLERFGLGGIVAQLEGNAIAEYQHQVNNFVSLTKRRLAAAPGHDVVRLVMQSALADPRLDGLQKNELQQLADERLAEPDYQSDVQRRFGIDGKGDTSIAMTPEHDKAIAAFLSNRQTLQGYTIEDRLRESVTVFGRVLEQDISAINGLIASGNTREAANRFATIRKASPSVAFSLKDKVSDKAYSLSLLMSFGESNVDKALSDFENVTDEQFSTARTIVKNEKTESGDKLSRLVNNSMRDLAVEAAKGGSSAVLDVTVQDAYEQLVYAGIARTIAAEGMMKPEELFTRGEAFAKNVLRMHVGSVKIGQDKYVLTSDTLRSYGFGDANGQILKGVSELWSREQAELENTFGGDVLLNFSKAQPTQKNGKDYIAVPIRVRDNLYNGDADGGFFEFPVNSDSELRRLLREKQNKELLSRPTDVRSLTQNPRYPR